MSQHERDEMQDQHTANDGDSESALGAPTGTDLDYEQVQAERDEALASWKRAQADYQNLRRRLQSDIDAAVQRAKQGLLQELLLVADYLDMALASPAKSEDARSLHAGVEMTRAQLLRALERENVRALPEQGRFDPAVHQAVESVASDAHEPGTIVGTLRRGYTIGGQVLRPAQVRVAAEPTSGE
jgi:molecular chaperone GrpE